MKFWEKVIFIHIFLLGLVFTFLVPPFQKPDEHGHFRRAFYLSRGYIYLFNDGKKLPLDRQLYELMTDKSLSPLPYHPERKIDPPSFTGPVFAGTRAFAPVYQTEKMLFIWGPLAYVPQAMGLLLARLLHLNAYLTFYAGRAAIFAFSYCMAIWLYRRTGKPYRYILLFVLSLPMTLHQLTAYSYDAVHCLLGFLVFSLFASMVSAKKVRYRQLILFGTAMVAFMISKLSYEPLLMLILVIPRDRIARNWLTYLKIITLWIAGVVSVYFLLTLPTYISAATYIHPAGINPGAQLRSILNNPFSYSQILASSSLNLLKFHVQGLIGILGWLDYSLDLWMYGVYGIAAVWLLYRLKIPPSDQLGLTRTVMLAALLLLNYVFIMTVFYLNWKTVGARQIDGTQGRYFIVFVPPMLYLLLQLKYWLRNK